MEDKKTIERLIVTLSQLKLMSNHDNFILFPGIAIPVNTKELSSYDLHSYIDNIHRFVSGNSHYTSNIQAGAFGTNFRHLSADEVYDYFKKYYREPLKNTMKNSIGTHYVFYRDKPFKVARYYDEGSLKDGVVYDVRYVGRHKILTGYGILLGKELIKSNRHEAYYAYRAHECPIFLAVINSNDEVIDQYAPLAPKNYALQDANGYHLYSVHLPYFNNTADTVNSLCNNEGRSWVFKTCPELFRMQVMLRTKADVAFNPFENVGYMIEKKEGRRADFKIFKVDKDNVREWKFKADLYFINKNKTAMYALNVNETENTITLITYSQGKLRQFKVNVKNLLKRANDIVGFKPLVNGSSMYMALYYVDKNSGDVQIATYGTKDNNLQCDSIKNNDSVKKKLEIEQDLLAENDGFQIYAIRNWGYVYYVSEKLKEELPLSYFVIDHGRKRLIKSNMLYRLLENNTHYVSMHGHDVGAMLRINTKVYIGNRYFYIYEESTDKYSSNAVTIYDRETLQPVKVIDRGVTVVPNYGLPPSRYIYTFKSTLRKENTVLTVIDSETLQEKKYNIPYFKSMFVEENKNAKLTPFLLKDIHIKADKKGNIIIYRQVSDDIPPDYISDKAFISKDVYFYVPQYCVYYIISGNKLYSFASGHSNGSHLMLSDLNILFDESYLQKANSVEGEIIEDEGR
jgi:hypothetical protein